MAAPRDAGAKSGKTLQRPVWVTPALQAKYDWLQLCQYRRVFRCLAAHACMREKGPVYAMLHVVHRWPSLSGYCYAIPCRAADGFRERGSNRLVRTQKVHAVRRSVHALG